MCTLTSHIIKYRIKNKYRTDEHPFASDHNVDITVTVHTFLSLSSYSSLFYCLLPTPLLTSIFYFASLRIMHPASSVHLFRGLPKYH